MQEINVLEKLKEIKSGLEIRMSMLSLGMERLFQKDAERLDSLIKELEKRQ